MQGLAIGLPVGRFGVNRSKDVEQIQKLLNQAIANRPELKASGIVPLEVDGDCGSLTVKAIESYQLKVMKWSGHACDGTVHPNRATWKSLNGNIGALRELRSMRASISTARASVASATAAIGPAKASAAAPNPPASAAAGEITAFKQGSYKDKLGEGSKTISSHGCALCTLTMAATYLGSNRPRYWPKDLKPKDLTPQKSNSILVKAGAFDGYRLKMGPAAAALGMNYAEYGKDTDLKAGDLKLIETHLNGGLHLVAANVDYKGNSMGDHWVLICRRDGTLYTATDPATGKTFNLSSKPPVDNERYGSLKDKRTGVLFGWSGSGGSKSQELYIVVRFALLSPLAG